MDEAGATTSGVTQAMASLGTSGQNANNINRDLFRRLEQLDRQLPVKPYKMKLRVRGLQTPDGTGEVELPLALPHDMFSAIFDAGPSRWCASIMRDMQGDRAQAFWDHVKVHSSWAATHPIVLAADARHLVPLAIYGDGVKVTCTDTVASITWNSLLVSKVPAIDSRLLICCIPTAHLLEDSLDAVCKVLAWSFGAMMDGRHPETDHCGNAWPPHSERAFASGQQLAQGYRGILVEARGDWEWHSKFWHVPTATSREFCFQCVVTQSDVWVRLERQPLRQPHWLQQLQPCNPLAHLPGMCTQMLRIDQMHTVNLGVGQWTNAATLLWLLDAGSFGGDNNGERLWAAWLRFVGWVNGVGLDTTQRPFTPRRLLMHVPGAFVELQSKAWNSRLVTAWLASVASQMDVPDDFGRLVVSLQMMLDESLHFCEERGLLLTPADAQRFCGLVEAAVTVYRDLAWRCLQRNLFWYPLRPKVHAWLELGRAVWRDKINPRYYHCFADESHLRLLTRCAKGCPRVNMSGAVLRRYLLRLGMRWRGLERQPKHRLRHVVPRVRSWKLRPKL